VNKVNYNEKQQNRKLLRILWCVISFAAVIVWGRVIFGFSAQNSTESGSLSERVCYAIVDEITQIRQEELTETEKLSLIEQLDHPVRKAAHMTEYAVFALLLFNLLCALGMTGRKRFPIVLLIVFCYAATDEFHQLFVEGRSGQFTDVLIDTAGGLIMLLLVAGVRKIWRRRA
jgi:VanZ family protein